MSDKTIPTGSANFTAVDLLPKYYQTADNKKFIQATIDQLVQRGTAKKINGYIGRENAKSANGNDIYVAAANAVRKNYQLEPAVVIDDSVGNTIFFKDYQDYINQLNVFGGNVSNHERINKQEFYSWDPHIDWDKFVNFQQYYWLPYGPDLIKISGQQLNVESTFTVEIVTGSTKQKEYLFTPNGLDRNPAITLYRGQTYYFEINSPGEPFSFKTSRTPGAVDRYTEGNNISAFGVTSGTIKFTVPVDAPDVMYYLSELDPDLGGLVKILDINENSFIDVEAEILGKKSYTLGNGTPLSNGMKVSFLGNVTPEKYATGEYYVEGVGTAIELIPTTLFEIISTYTSDKSVAFDSTEFDLYPFAAASSFAATPDYIVINRSSKDRNPWSRYNRWFHKDIITASAKYNNKLPSYDLAQRASRPIIEFEANLKLFNFGRIATVDVDLVDDYTTDVFSTIEGTAGYNIDGEQITQGMRVLFTADKDTLVKDNIYRVEFVNIQNSGIGVPQIRLILDEAPARDRTIIVRQGKKYQGSTFWYNGSTWKVSQQKTKVNQAPLFDLFDDSYTSYSEYVGSTFKGTKLFSYKEGTGVSDKVLNFPLSYQNINNIGDILFNFDLLNDTFQYKENDILTTKVVNTGYLSKLEFNNVIDYKNGWQQSQVERYQAAVRIYKNSGIVNNFALDIFDNKFDLNDLEVRLFVNGDRLETENWKLVDGTPYKKIVLNTDLQTTDVLTIKAFAKQPINGNGFYELPINLQSNPLNTDMTSFTLGEVKDHLNSIVDNIQPIFKGSVAGSNNLRDLGNVTPYGTKFVQHSGPSSLALYHITSEQNNIVRAIEKARDDYGKFKRNFLSIAYQLGEDTSVVQQVDLILEKLAANKTQQSPYYFSDMAPWGGKKVTNYTVQDYRIKKYPLSDIFDLSVLTNKAVNIYIGNEQLLYGKDYVFTKDGYVEILLTLTDGQVITIYEYDTTDGSYIPATPTKLGLWPKFEPKIYTDISLLTPRKMIQGHDGSQTLAFDDYRDDLILELEKRIYNNIQVEYDSSVFDIHRILPGYYRDSDYSLDEFNAALAPSFYKWVTLAGQNFSKPIAYDSTNTFTYNYRNHTAPDGRSLPGFWRGIYRWIYDTDRPNICPWEMLGFSEEPLWWQEVYGPAPYTNNNIIMWQDIALGAVKQPGKPVEYRTQYARPDLLDHIPVDSDGNLVSPASARLSTGVFTSDAQSYYIFGDIGPVESAWRRSSYYPFSFLIASILLKPAYTFATCLDRYRTKRNICGQLIYAPTGLRVKPSDIILPSIYASKTRVQTSGILNYLVEQLTNDKVEYYNNYQYNLDNLQVKLSYRIAGFTSKDNFNLLLDSKSPSAKGNIFIPPENFKIVYNTSSPVKKLSYSGVIITKLAEGFEIKGYSLTESYFKYYPWLRAAGTSINVGGISASFVAWAANKTYAPGQIVYYNGKYYRATTTVTSTDTFESRLFAPLSELPISGGTTAIFRNAWDKQTELVLPYGSVLPKIQDVVDFLLGYGEYLKAQGFIFEDFNNNLASVSNWETSTKEFMFWTTQSWSTGAEKWLEWVPNQTFAYGTVVRYNGEYYRAIQDSPANTIFNVDEYVKLDGLSTVGSAVISLSPAANGITFRSEMSVADDISNPFNDYEIFKVDGTGLQPLDINAARTGNLVTFSPNDTDGTIYNASFYLVQKEQVVILDNVTIFNDVLYNLESGYRQERIKVSGFVSAEWFGGFEIPGFIYDRADIKQWQPWVDYKLGDIIQNQGFYYSAKRTLAGSAEFEPINWNQISKPTPALLPNWTYKAGQFENFYDLNTDSFDTGQQKIAQHLVGYQKRSYLNNVIQNNISEFQFYQGMIKEKGTQNSLNKLFDVLSSSNKESLSFYEEWAVRVGQYGASESFDSVEFIIDQTSIANDPQGYILSNESLTSNFNINITSNEVYLKPENYNSNPWPVDNTQKYFLRTPGYVQSGDDVIQLKTIDDITSVDISKMTSGMYIWTSFENTSWNIFRFTPYKLTVINATNDQANKKIVIETEEQVDPSIAGQYVGIAQVSFAGFYKVSSVSLNSFTLDAGNSSKINWPDQQVIQEQIEIFRLYQARAKTIDDANSIIKSYTKIKDKIWIDQDPTSRWATLELNQVYNKTEVVKPYPTSDMEHGKVVVMNDEGTLAAVATRVGQVIVYEKQGKRWVFKQIIKKPFTAQYVFQQDLNTDDMFAETLAMSPDGEFLAVGMPRAGNLATITLPTGNVVCNQSASNSAQTQTGCVSLYQKTSYNEYTHLFTLASGDDTTGQRFGSTLQFGNGKLFIGTIGSTNYGTEATVFELRYVEASGTVATVNTNADGGDANAVVTVIYDAGVSTSTYNPVTDTLFDAGSALNILSTADRWILTRPGISVFAGTTIGFGKSIAVSSDNSTLAIAAPYAGRVYVYKLSLNNVYELFQTIDGPTQQVSSALSKDGVIFFNPTPLDSGSGFRKTNDDLFNKYLQNIETTGGSGQGLTVDVLVDNFGVVDRAVVRNPGNNYKVGDIVTIINPLGVGGVTGLDIEQLKGISYVGAINTPVATTTLQSGVNLEIKVATSVVPSALTGDIVLPVKNVEDFKVGEEIFSSSVTDAFVSGTTVSEKNVVEFTSEFNNTTLTVTSITGGSDDVVAYVYGSITGTTLSIDEISGQNIVPGMILSGLGLADGTYIVSGSGTSWTINESQAVPRTRITATLPGKIRVGMYVNNPALDGPTTFTGKIETGGTSVFNSGTTTLIGGTVQMYGATISGITLTYASKSGEVQPGMILTGSGVASNTKILYGSGDTWTVSISQTVNATTITGNLNSGTITGQTLTFVSTTGVSLEAGMVLSGGSVIAGTKIVYGAGTTWYVDTPQTSTCTTATKTYATINGNTLTFVGTSGASLAVGMFLVGGNVLPGTYITSGSGTTWYVNTSQTATAEYATFQTTLVDAVISGTTLTFTSFTGAPLQVGMVLSGGSVAAGTYVVSGLDNEWTISLNQVATCTTATPVILTASGTITGEIRLGQILKGTGVVSGTSIVKEQTGLGGAGTYFVTPIQNATTFSASAGYVAPQTYITGYGTGTGGIGTYILNQSPLAPPTRGSSLTINKPLANDLISDEEVTSVIVSTQGFNYFVGDKVTFDVGNGPITTTVTEISNNAKVVVSAIGDGSISKDASQFGTSISITKDANYLAIGSPLHTATKDYEGRVFVYSNLGFASNNYTIYQNIDSPHAEQGNLFGSKVAFSNNGKTLAVYSSDANNEVPTTFDNLTTSFDTGSLNFMEITPRSGRVDIFDKYVSKWICGEILVSSNSTTDAFGRSIAVSDNVILVGAPSETEILTDSKAGKTLTNLNAGKVYAYEKTPNTYSWVPVHTQESLVNVSKIKQAFLYNKVSNQLVRYLDIIDPILGKIAGPAEQELSYKTFYDPAIYSVGNGNVNSDIGTAWTTDQVGKLWWDLRTAKFIDNHSQDYVYRSSTLNMLATGASIDVYEWVSTSLTPTEWKNQADTPLGLTNGISGTPLYTDAYSIKQEYDIFTKSFRNTYYFWVKNKSIVPAIQDRKISALDVANFIGNPRGKGHPFISLTGSNSFSLVNCQSLLSGSDVVLSIEYWKIDDIHQNVHTQWKLIDNNPSTSLPVSIENKWFDSLCGKDQADRPVPDLNLPPKLKYGVESRPRQSMFVNSFEALKQFVEKVNRILINEQVVSQKNISSLKSYDVPPTAYSGEYGDIIDTDAELRLVPVSTAKVASLTPVIQSGSVVSVNIDNSGFGYKVAPVATVVGSGKGAKIKLEVNSAGQITNVVVLNGGKGYDQNTTINVKLFSVLVNQDSYAQNNWSIYSYNPATKVWTRTKTQAYDVRNYWVYADWYATGFNQFTAVDYLIDTFAELGSIVPEIGQTVKIKTAGGSGTWELLSCYAKTDSVDWTDRYKVVGIEKGTIQLSNKLYSFVNNNIGFDGALFDGIGYDFTASKELRIILECLRDEILTDTLKQEYLNLFFDSVRYAHSEQTYIDWAFKTSFVKAQHNVGSLKQTITYKNDNLEDFQDYISEVIPYRTTVREYVSNYTTIDNSKSVVTDFDLPAIYKPVTNDIIRTKVVDGKVIADDSTINVYPWRNWFEYVGFSISSIVITNPGSGYVTEPTVRIISKSGTGAVAKAFIANGKLSRIALLSKGSGYLEAPTILIDGGGSSTSIQATAIAIIGNSVVRSNLIKIKFDRTTSKYYTLQLNETDTLIGTGNRTQFALNWAPDIKIGTSSVKISIPSLGTTTLLRDEYVLKVVKSNARGYTSYSGSITFKKAPALNSVITVEYLKDINLLNASDRVQFYYDPATGQLGKDLSQLMTGVDYGGVVVTGVDYNISQGWGSVGYMTDPWDSYENTYEDYVVTIDATTSKTREFLLPYQPATLEQINIYYAQIEKTNYTSDGIQVIYQLAQNYTSIDAQVTLKKNIVGATTTVTDTNIDVVNITETKAGFNYFVGTNVTVNLSVDKPVTFDSGLFGGVVQGQTYYVKSIIDTNTFTVSLAIGGPEFTLTNATGTMSMRYVTPSNKLTGSTTGLTVGTACQFSGTLFGGIQANKTYYIKQIFNSTSFSISTTLNGPVLVLTSGSGTMNLRQVAGTGSLNIKLNSTEGLKVGDALSVSVSGAVADGTVISKIVNSTDIVINNILYGSLLAGTEIVFTRTLVAPVDYRFLASITIQLAEPIYSGGVLTISSSLDPIRIDDENFNKNWIITGTNGTTNEITTDTPVTFAVGDSIVFQGVAFGGLTLGEKYYIKEIVNNRKFKVSATPVSPVYQLVTATGAMTAQVRSNDNAVMATYIGDGTAPIIKIPSSFNLPVGDLMIFRKSTSDGSVAANDNDIDTALDGGNLIYSTATGLAADDILIDGDGFVTPTSSPAPEEVVPGQVVDAVAIKVFDRPTDGSATVKTLSYIADGTNKKFDIGQFPNSKQAVFVKLDNNVVTLGVDYYVDYPNKKAVFINAPSAGSIVTVISFGFNGSNVLDVDYFVSDGKTKEFITKAPYLNSDFTYLVYLDGNPISPTIFKTDTTYESSDRIGFRFSIAPPKYSVLNYLIVSGSQQTYAIFKSEKLATNGSNTYTLQNTVGSSLPLESSVIVRANQEILKGPNTAYFTIGSNNYTYVLDKLSVPPYGVKTTDIVVYADGNLLQLTTDYVVDTSVVSVSINRKVYSTYKGKNLVISIAGSQDYNIVGNTITFNNSYSSNDYVEVISAYKHDILQIQRKRTKASTNLKFEINSPSYYRYVGVLGGKLDIPASLISENQVWVTKNRKILTNSIDFRLNEDLTQIILAEPPAIDDEFEIILFAGAPVEPGLSFMQFKDMLNRTVYKRLNGNKQSFLTQDLYYYDSQIFVKDAGKFDKPNPELNKPGIIEINGERIEYFTIKNNNVLGQLRRGTLGTGIPTVHGAGSKVQDIGPSETIPYSDITKTEQVTIDGVTTDLIIPVSFIPKQTDGGWTKTASEYKLFESAEVNKYVSKTGSGPYNVTFAVPQQSYAPSVGKLLLVEGNTDSYNGYHRVVNSDISVKLTLIPTAVQSINATASYVDVTFDINQVTKIPPSNIYYTISGAKPLEYNGTWLCVGSTPASITLRISNNYGAFINIPTQVVSTNTITLSYDSDPGTFNNLSLTTISAPKYGQADEIDVFVGGYDDSTVWAPNTIFEAEQIITINSYTYRITAKHRSGETFNSPVTTLADDNTVINTNVTATSVRTFFIGNIRLKKHPYSVYNVSRAPESPEGDVSFAADFAVDGINSELILSNKLTPGTVVTIIRRTGKTWTENNEPLQTSNSKIAKFITAVPGTWVSRNIVTSTETGVPTTTTTFDTVGKSFDNNNTKFDEGI